MFDTLRKLVFLLKSLKPRHQLGIVALFFCQIILSITEGLSIGAVLPLITSFSGTTDDYFIELIKPLIGDVANTTNEEFITIFLGILVVLICLTAIFRVSATAFEQYLSASIGTELSKQLFSKILQKPYAFFLDSKTGELIGEATNDMKATISTINVCLSLSASMILTAVVTIGLSIYALEVVMMLIALLMLFYAGITHQLKARMFQNGTVWSQSYKVLVSQLREAIGGIKQIKIHNCVDQVVESYTDADRKFRLAQAENAIFAIAPRHILEPLLFVGMAVLFMVRSSSGIPMSETIALIGVFAVSSYRLMPAAQKIYVGYTALLANKTPIDNIVASFSEAANVPQVAAVKDKGNIFKSLEFSNVSYRYPNNTNEDDAATVQAIERISFKIESGSIIGVVGPSGSGKTTLTNLILGLLQPTDGSISVNDCKLSPERIRHWQDRISFVSQDTFTSDGTIRDNIAFGVPEELIDDKRVQRCAKIAQLDAFISTLRLGYFEPAGEMGARLSGGQIQRLNIARSLYRDPEIIIFDEATSAIDNATEAALLNTLQELEGITKIFIAHNASNIANADNILVLKNGRLVGQGKYDALLASNDTFHSLFGPDGSSPSPTN